MGPSVYEPFGAAKALFKCRDPEVLIEGPAGTGKTRAILMKARIAAERYPGSRIVFVRKTRESMTETVLVEWETAVLGPAHYLCNGASRRVRQSYEFENGSTVVVAGLDKPSKLMSAQYDMVCSFESTELLENDWEMILTRLRNGKMPYQQGLADCNPGPPTHWLNRRATDGKMTRLVSRHQDNPRWWDAEAGKWTEAGERYVMGTLAKLTGVRKLRLFDGIWAASEGMVYESWDASVNVIDPFPIPPDWRRFRSIDFGYTNPFVCQWWAVDPDGRMYLYREIYKSQRLVSDHAGLIQTLSAGERIEGSVADHDAEDRATLHKAGIGTIPARKDVQHGIQLVSDRIIKAGDGRPRLFIMRDCTVERDSAMRDKGLPSSTLEEIDSYIWAKNASGTITKEEPVKENDHGMDAMRYAVMHVDGGRPMIASVVSPGSVAVSAPSGESARDMYVRLRQDPDWGWEDV